MIRSGVLVLWSVVWAVAATCIAFLAVRVNGEFPSAVQWGALAWVMGVLPFSFGFAVQNLVIWMGRPR